MIDSLISFKNVHFSFKNNRVFESLNFEITENQLIGIVGVNGSGKSTLMRLTLGLHQPQKGDIHILGNPPGAFQNRTQVASALQDIDFPSTEKVHEILEFVCAQYENSVDSHTLIEDFGLSEFQKKACGQLSGGMKRRLSLACAFAGQPRIVLLDEPTTGLDRASREKLFTSLKKYQSQQKTLILMISHHPEEVTDTVDQFFHIHDSHVQFISPDKMRELTGLRKILFDSDKAFNSDFAIQKNQNGTKHTLIVKNSDQFVKELCAQKHPFKNLEIQKVPADQLIGEIL